MWENLAWNISEFWSLPSFHVFTLYYDNSSVVDCEKQQGMMSSSDENKFLSVDTTKTPATPCLWVTRISLGLIGTTPLATNELHKVQRADSLRPQA